MFKALKVAAALSLILFCFAGLLLVRNQLNNMYYSIKVRTVSAKINKNQESIGEKIIYEIKMGGLTIGESTFTQLKNEDLDGRNLLVMLFTTKLANFSDTEKIYADPQTYLPIKVMREISNFMIKEIIIEDYDQENFVVNINKKKGFFKSQLNIKKESQINNAILLPQYVRFIGMLDENKPIPANFPTRSYSIEFAGKEEIEVPAGKFKTYHFKSVPSQINIWISQDGRKIPVKIEGNGALGIGYTMVLKEYIEP